MLSGDLAIWKRAASAALDDYSKAYEAYFTRNLARVGAGKTMLDPRPRGVALPGLGLAAIGRSPAEAALVGDIAKAWMKRAYGRDRRLSLTHEGAPVSGEIVGLDEFGALRLKADNGQVYTVTGGDIEYGVVLNAAGH